MVSLWITMCITFSKAVTSLYNQNYPQLSTSAARYTQLIKTDPNVEK